MRLVTWLCFSFPGVVAKFNRRGNCDGNTARLTRAGTHMARTSPPVLVPLATL